VEIHFIFHFSFHILRLLPGGVVSGSPAPTVHLLPEAEEIFAHELGEDFQISLAALLCPLGFGIAFFVEQVRRLPTDEEKRMQSWEVFPLLSNVASLC